MNLPTTVAPHLAAYAPEASAAKAHTRRGRPLTHALAR